MASVRQVFGYHRLDSADASFPGDSSVVPPTVTPQGWSPAVSAQVGLACAITATGTNGPQCGLGSAGNPLLGKIVQVDLDGVCTVQHEGFMYLPYNTGTPPVPGGYVECDGTGKVRAAAAPTKAVCVGFGTDPAPVGFESTATTLAIVKL